MTQYNNLNVKLYNSELTKLRPGVKNRTEATLNLSWNEIGGSNDDTTFPYKLLSTDRQVSRLRKAFKNNL